MAGASIFSQTPHLIRVVVLVFIYCQKADYVLFTAAERGTDTVVSYSDFLSGGEFECRS